MTDRGLLMMLGILTGVAGAVVLADAINWQAAAGVFLMMWGDNMCRTKLAEQDKPQ